MKIKARGDFRALTFLLDAVVSGPLEILLHRDFKNILSLLQNYNDHTTV